MNRDLPIGHSDPRTEIVPLAYLRLAADVVMAKQDLTYWNTAAVPYAPNNRVALEEVRQAAVFLPLILPAVAYSFFGLAGIGTALVVALPIMKSLHNSLQSAIVRKGTEWFARDAGRYAFTLFMCKEFDLRPEDVTIKLVLKMCEDLKIWLAVANRLRLEGEARAALAGKSAAHFSKVLPDDDNTRDAAPMTAAYVGAASVEADELADVASQEFMFNPATGLPMMDAILDVHGNVFGGSSVDDHWGNSGNFNSGTNDSFSNAGYSYDWHGEA